LGFIADDVTAKLATRWKFPAPIVEGVRYQTCPHEAEAAAPLVALSALLDHIEESRELDSGMDDLLD